MKAGLLVPNLLSGVRLALVPWVAILILREDYRAALGWFAAAAATDVLDGFLARRYRWTTRAGALLDPLADKGMMSVVYVCLGLRGGLPWWLVGLVFGRDLLLLGMAVFAVARTGIRDFPVSVWGKLSTNLQVAAAVAALLWLASLLPGRVAEAAVWLAALATVWSGVHYFVSALRRYRAWKASFSGSPPQLPD